MPSDEARRFLVGAKTGTRFTFHYSTDALVIRELHQGGYIEPAQHDDHYPDTAPTMYRFTRKGARAGNGHE